MTHRQISLVLAAAALIFSLGRPASANPPVITPAGPSREGVDFFEKKVRPLLVRRCYECHSGDPAKAKGGFTLDTRDGLLKGGQSGAVVAPGSVDGSLLIEAIRYEGLEMPPKEQMSDEEIATIVQWVEMGLPDPRFGRAAHPGKIDLEQARKWWSFQRPKASPPPEVQNSAWPRTDIDRFILARMEKEKLHPVADADRETLIRRVTFDLIGLPPTPAEIDAFLNDPSEHALATVVDRLLASPQFGEKWGRHWLDVARYGESTGKERNVPFRYAWRYRDYVIDSFNADKPYDRFLREQLAGDLLQTHSKEDRNTLLVATGFLAIGPKGINEKNSEQYKMDIVDDQIDVTMRGILGLTVACARCHDHKFDPIPTTDYYSVAGVFRSTETFCGVGQGKKNAGDRFLLALADSSHSLKLTAEQQQQQEAHFTALNELEGRLNDLQNRQKKVKKQIKKGAKAKKAKKGKNENKAEQADTKDDQQALQKRLKKINEEIKKAEGELDELGRKPTPPRDLVMAVRDAEQPADCHVLERGEVTTKGPEVPRGGLSVLKTVQTAHVRPEHSGRLELANWISDANNPLTARVMVNRVWMHLFGKGLVETPDNFGALGEEPSHPELLDTLAVQFMHDHWSVKKLIRSIVLSRTYQLSSTHDGGNYAVDPTDRFLWRSERRRLDAEEIRDAILAASGALDLTRPEGSLVMKLGGAEIGKGNNLASVDNPGPVRSVYLPLLRGQMPEALSVFDMPDPSLIVSRREVTTVATQALYLMNNPFVLNQSERMAKRLLAEKELNEASRIDLAFRLTLGRRPADNERAEMTSFLHDTRKAIAEGEGDHKHPNLVVWTNVCQALLASAEFRYLY